MTELALPQIDGLENLRVIGTGGSANVYRALQSSLGRDVAVKVLHESAVDEKVRRLFDIERQILAGLPKSPYIVSVYSGGFTAAGEPWLAMELCPGGSLADYVREKGPLGAAHLVRVALRVATALDFAHRRQLIHRDVKPENVLISEVGDPVLSDFGIASVLGQQLTVGETGLSPHHVAPEILHSIPAGTASDLYSLGSTLYMLATGLPPHQRHVDEVLSLAETLARVIHEPSHELPATADATRSTRQLVRSLLTKDHVRRPASAADIVAALKRIEVELGTTEVDLPLPVLRNSPPTTLETTGWGWGNPQPTDSAGSHRPPSGATIAWSSTPTGTTTANDLATGGSLDLSSSGSTSARSAGPFAGVSTGPFARVSTGPLLPPSNVQPSKALPSKGQPSPDAPPADTPPLADGGSESVGSGAVASRLSGLRLLVGLGIAVVALVAVTIGVRRFTNETTDVAPVATLAPVADVELIPLVAPVIRETRRIDSTQAVIRWDHAIPGASYTVELSRSDAPEDLVSAPIKAPVGATTLEVSGLQLGWTPCFEVVARDPNAATVERSAQVCGDNYGSISP